MMMIIYIRATHKTATLADALIILNNDVINCLERIWNLFVVYPQMSIQPTVQS